MRLSWFSSVPPVICRYSISITLQPLPSKSFPVLHLSIILPFGAI
jgi:hypothetical protein